MNFSLNELLVSTYGRFPEVERRPIIGITANYSDIDATVRDRYYKQIISAGGVPVIIPPVADAAIITDTLDKVDGILLTGGGDYNPLWCGEEPSPKLHNINRERDAAELMLTRLAYNRQIPMLGICRGIQIMNVLEGGTLYQDIPTERLDAVKHSMQAPYDRIVHEVFIEPDTPLYDLYGSRLMVNSCHHQAVCEIGSRLCVMAKSPDSIIEALYRPDKRFVQAVQWHPEMIFEKDPTAVSIVKSFVDACR
mgnify:CR=1 FL=1